MTKTVLCNMNIHKCICILCNTTSHIHVYCICLAHSGKDNRTNKALAEGAEFLMHYVNWRSEGITSMAHRLAKIDVP